MLSKEADMRDALLIAGTIAAATKQTRVYSADVLDLGVAKQNIGYTDAAAKFQLGEAVASGDTYKFEVYESADNSTFTLAVDSGAAITTGSAGDIITVPLPKTIKRYVKLAVYPDSSGTLDAQDIDSWIDFKFD